MLNLVLYQPEIAPNTGNLIRLSANAGFALHLIKPLGFDLDDKKLRRAGLDYGEYANLKIHNSFEEYLKQTNSEAVYACTTKASLYYTEVEFKPRDTLLFGPETRGLPENVLNSPDICARIKIPMHPSSRSLNLSNSVAIVSYEAWRQLEFLQP